MKYNFNGKDINIPDGDIKKLMVSLDIPKDEAIDDFEIGIDDAEAILATLLNILNIN